MPFALNERLIVPTHSVQKWVSIMLAVSGAAQLLGSPIFGWLADRTTADRTPTRRPTFLIGSTALIISTGLLCFGRSILVLLIGRALQGFSAAAVWVVGLAMLVDTVGENRMAAAIGYISLATVGGLVTAPVLGGLLYERRGYYSIFMVALALIALDGLLRLLVIEQGSAAQWHGKDFSGGYGTFEVMCSRHERIMPSENSWRYGVDSASLQSELSRDTDSSDTDSDDVDSVFCDGLVTPGFMLPSSPLLTLLLSPRLLVALWGCFAQTLLLTGLQGVLPLFVQKTFGWNSFYAGLMFFFLFSPTLAVPLIDRLSDRFGPRYIATVGFTVATAPVALLLLTSYPIPHVGFLLSGLLFLVGLCLRCVIGPIGSEISHVVREHMRDYPDMFGPSGGHAQAFAFYNVAFGAGSIVGPVWAGLLENWAGWDTMCWSLAALSAFSAVPTLIFTEGFYGEDEY
ncbi:hypothetical protein MMC07_000823 [Pseudocyphellaria aurata]|nr:hypothetical protein [Pseudocyphellaria aurata]